MDHPFWRSSFKLAKAEDLQALLESGVPDLVIDTDKGLDVESRASTQSKIHRACAGSTEGNAAARSACVI